MPKTLDFTGSRRFFLTFQRYISTTSTPRLRNQFQYNASPCLRSIFLAYPSRSPVKRRQTTFATSQPSAPKPPTHYDLFPSAIPKGPPPSGPFAIDLERLKREFLQLQAKAHPDRHAGADKARAEGTSALINEAYKTLQDPLRRAQYLLSLQGIDVAEDETAKVEDPELLGEVLEVREMIEAAEKEADLTELKSENGKRVGDSVETLADMFEEGNLDGAKSEAVKLKYWINIKQALDEWEPGKPVVLIH
ncbi:MAG: hypothetical protein Q9191_002095 [Dirinaria sp. TL-2023a]